MLIGTKWTTPLQIIRKIPLRLEIIIKSVGVADAFFPDCPEHEWVNMERESLELDVPPSAFWAMLYGVGKWLLKDSCTSVLKRRVTFMCCPASHEGHWWPLDHYLLPSIRAHQILWQEDAAEYHCGREKDWHPFFLTLFFEESWPEEV